MLTRSSAIFVLPSGGPVHEPFQNRHLRTSLQGFPEHIVKVRQSYRSFTPETTRCFTKRLIYFFGLAANWKKPHFNTLAHVLQEQRFEVPINKTIFVISRNSYQAGRATYPTMDPTLLGLNERIQCFDSMIGSCPVLYLTMKTSICVS